MRICVMSRNEVIDFCRYPHLAQFAIVSISTPNEEYDSAPSSGGINNVIDICPVQFFDLDNTYPIKEGLMSYEDAKKIVDFVSKYKDNIIIVHCDAGQSRSAGVAAALSKYYNNDDSEYFDNPHFTPNMWCYRQIMNALADM